MKQELSERCTVPRDDGLNMVGFPFQLVRKTRRAGGFSPSSERTDESALLRAGPPLCRADLLTTQSEGCDALLATASSVGADAVHCSVPNRLSYICLYIYIYIYTYLCVYLCLSLSLFTYTYMYICIFVLISWRPNGGGNRRAARSHVVRNAVRRAHVARIRPCCSCCLSKNWP